MTQVYFYPTRPYAIVVRDGSDKGVQKKEAWWKATLPIRPTLRREEAFYQKEQVLPTLTEDDSSTPTGCDVKKEA